MAPMGAPPDGGSVTGGEIHAAGHLMASVKDVPKRQRRKAIRQAAALAKDANDLRGRLSQLGLVPQEGR